MVKWYVAIRDREGKNKTQIREASTEKEAWEIRKEMKAKGWMAVIIPESEYLKMREEGRC